MGLFNSINISASGLTAERLRLDLIANNIANINTTRDGQTTPAGNPIPYSREVAVFTPRTGQANFADVLNSATSGVSSSATTGDGVQVSAIVQDQSPFRMEYDPSSPDAAKPGDPGIPAGYVRLPNVNIATEMVDMISASRAYEANVTMMNASKSMFTKALEIGR